MVFANPIFVVVYH